MSPAASAATGLACFRVPVTRGERSISPIIRAGSATEAKDRAAALGEAVLRYSPKLSWVRSDWPRDSLPAADQTTALAVGTPVLIHPAGRHP